MTLAKTDLEAGQDVSPYVEQTVVDAWHICDRLRHLTWNKWTIQTALEAREFLDEYIKKQGVDCEH